MESVEKKVAQQLLEIEAVQLNMEKPFEWASGWLSPIYCDNRKVLSVPPVRNMVCEALCQSILHNYPSVEVIAGVATGAIAMGALVADRLDKPFIYIRPKRKDHGTGAQIEGKLEPKSKVVVVEDLISTGHSAISAVECLRISCADVLGVVAIFSYNFDVARRAFEKSNCELHTLTNYNTLIQEAAERNYINEEQLKTLKVWRLTPNTWGR
ncbi:MAG: Orotate phosphoribosyltransferase [Bacteroidetes bacterium ADurb.Bin037]|nr:MAG: Orotate phosphoribosyltransferase [Bacteroidetes bacterium ADurb.Bin037]HPW78347.1 orotate phosphoribosyltransferase [Bacteroidales bacterium]HQB56322.1 orotate phosphoribosyltransferase [Bacteroidales bacterium]